MKKGRGPGNTKRIIWVYSYGRPITLAWRTQLINKVNQKSIRSISFLTNQRSWVNLSADRNSQGQGRNIRNSNWKINQCSHQNPCIARRPKLLVRNVAWPSGKTQHIWWQPPLQHWSALFSEGRASQLRRAAFNLRLRYRRVLLAQRLHKMG